MSADDGEIKIRYLYSFRSKRCEVPTVENVQRAKGDIHALYKTQKNHNILQVNIIINDIDGKLDLDEVSLEDVLKDYEPLAEREFYME